MTSITAPKAAMKINVNNAEKLEAAIAKAEGPRSKSRKITPAIVLEAVGVIENRLKDLMFVKDWRGLIFGVDWNAQSFPSSYQGAPESTQFRLERGANGWFVVSVSRGICSSETQRIVPVNLHKFGPQIADYVSRPSNF